MRLTLSRPLSLASILLAASLALAAPLDAAASDGDDDGSAPVTAGAAPATSALSAELAAAERLTKAERWAEAAILLDRISQSETSPTDDDARAIASYELAIALGHLKLKYASLNALLTMAGSKDHPRHAEALRQLGELGEAVPEVDDIARELDAYVGADVERLGLAKGDHLASTLYYLLGRNAWRRREYEDATNLFDKVDISHERYLEAQIFGGTSYVMLRKVVPAAKRFFRVIEATDERGTEPFKDGEALRELAAVSMARAYYTSAFAGTAASINALRIAAAVKYWGKVAPGSSLYAQSLLEQSWAYFMAGDYGRTLGNIHTIEAPYFTAHDLPEADVVKAIVSFVNCRYEDAETIVARMWQTYVPIRRRAAKAMASLEESTGEARFFAALTGAKERKEAPPPDLQPAVEWSARAPPVTRRLAKVRALDEELGRLSALPADFQRSEIGRGCAETLRAARENSVFDVARLARARGEQRIADIDASLKDGARLLLDIHAARKAKLEEPIRNDYRMASPTPTAAIFQDIEHVVWPFDGEYWKDELGSYRAIVVSRCDR